MIWLVLASVLVVAAMIAIVPVTVRVSVRGRGDGEGMWSAAGGLQVGPASVSGVRARGVPARVSLHLLGHRVFSKATGASKTSLKVKAKRKRAKARPILERVGTWTPRSADLTLLMRSLRWIRYDHIRGRLEYALDDVVLAGRIYAALTVAAAWTPPGVRVSYYCDWMGVERLDAELSGQCKVWPLPLLVTGAWWWMTRRSGDKSRGTPRVPVEQPSG
jgi:hypothetical protein